MVNLWRGESNVEIEAALAATYPTLQLFVENGKRIIRGAFNVEHGGQFLGVFQVEVLLDETDVLGLPIVKEVGGRIPRVPERHINRRDGSACLYLPEDLVMRTKEPFGIVAFLDGPVRSFFVGQLCVESGDPFPFGEWGHGVDGARELLLDLFGFDDLTLCVAFLDLLSRKVIKAHWPCPCGNRRALRDCHYRLVQRVRHRLSLRTRRFLLSQARMHLLSTKTEEARGSEEGAGHEVKIGGGMWQRNCPA